MKHGEFIVISNSRSTGEILKAVIDSGCLGQSERQRALFEYLLRENEEGRGHLIKAYSIAIDVLGRDESFDNSMDSIVRVEMYRLRKNLKLYNATANIFHLDIPPAKYSVNIEEIQRSIFKTKKRPIAIAATVSMMGLFVVALVSGAGIWRATIPFTNNIRSGVCSLIHPNIVLIPTKNMTGSTSNDNAALLTDRYLRTGLSQYSNVSVSVAGAPCTQTTTPLYTMNNMVLEVDGHTKLFLELIHNDSQSIVYSKVLELSDDEGIHFKHLDYRLYKIASVLAHRKGAVLIDAPQRDWDDIAKKASFSCNVNAYSWYLSHKENKYTETLACLKKSIADNINDPATYGLLAKFYVEQARGYIDKTVEDPLKEARKYIAIGLELGPLNAEVLSAKLWIEIESPAQNLEEIKVAIQTLERHQPYNVQALNDAAIASGYKIGNWMEASRMAETVNRIDGHRTSFVNYVEAGNTLLFSSPEHAYTIALKLKHRDVAIANIMLLAAANKSGNTDDIPEYVANLERMGMEGVPDYRAFIHGRRYEPMLTKELLKWVGYRSD
ncbi:MAG: hypothetical protein COA43_15005 [Robiginitomaculum sp.]|nr:MAG: hypothetical protein COA43_15005 [Robiginitomaculum sp.]